MIGPISVSSIVVMSWSSFWSVSQVFSTMIGIGGVVTDGVDCVIVHDGVARMGLFSVVKSVELLSGNESLKMTGFFVLLRA